MIKTLFEYFVQNRPQRRHIHYCVELQQVFHLEEKREKNKYVFVCQVYDIGILYAMTMFVRDIIKKYCLKNILIQHDAGVVQLCVILHYTIYMGKMFLYISQTIYRKKFNKDTKGVVTAVSLFCNKTNKNKKNS